MISAFRQWICLVKDKVWGWPVPFQSSHLISWSPAWFDACQLHAHIVRTGWGWLPLVDLFSYYNWQNLFIHWCCQFSLTSMCGAINHSDESAIASWCLSLPSIYENMLTCNLINQVVLRCLVSPTLWSVWGGREGREEGGREGRREGGKGGGREGREEEGGGIMRKEWGTTISSSWCRYLDASSKLVRVDETQTVSYTKQQCTYNVQHDSLQYTNCASGAGKMGLPLWPSRECWVPLSLSLLPRSRNCSKICAANWDWSTL